MKEIRIGIIGTGIIAHQHLKQYQAIDGVRVVAACDLDAQKLAAFCLKYGIAHQYADYRALLARDDLDAVDVCLHNNLHAPISIAVMASGKHCYCEKPMAGSYIEAAAMKEAAARYGVRLHIQLGMLYGGQMIAAKKLIDGGYLGEIYHARSYGYRRRGRPFVDGYAEKEFDSAYWAGHGALYDMGVYHISQLLYLMHTPKVERISGSIYQRLGMDEALRRAADFSVEELGVGLVKFAGGQSMDILESWAIHAAEFPLSSLHGDKGGLQFMASEREDRQTLKFLSEIEGYPAQTLLDISTEDRRLFRFDRTRPLYENSQAHWIGVLREEIAPIDTAHIALETMLISEGVFLSHKLGREVCADEIPALCEPISVREQETPFGKLTYPPYPFAL